MFTVFKELEDLIISNLIFLIVVYHTTFYLSSSYLDFYKKDIKNTLII